MQQVLLLTVMIFWAVPAWAATYYVDPTCRTGGDGTTTTCGAHGPFKAWADVPWGAGNTYSQKGGTTAFEQITVGASGKPGKVITITSYGTGSANLNGSITIPPGSWKGPDTNGVYSMAGFGYNILEDGVFLKWASGPGCQNGNFHYKWGSASPEYYKPTSGTPAGHTVEKVRTAGIQLGTHSHIAISGFTFTKYRYGITGNATKKGTTNNYITITDNSFTNLQFGVWINFNNATSQGISVRNNKFDYLFSSIELQNQGDCKSNGIHNLVEISHNTITHCSQVSGVNGAYDWSQVDTAGWDKEGIGFQDLSNSNVHHNSISGVCRGIVLFTCANDESFNNNFFRNYIKTDKEPLMFQPRFAEPPARSFYNNNAYHNILIGGKAGFAAAIYAANVPNPVATYNNIYNNTLIPATNGIFFDKVADYYNIKNNIIAGGANYQIVQMGEAAPQHNTFDHNLYVGKSWTTFKQNNKKGFSWLQWKSLGTNYDDHSPGPANPHFKNAAGGDFSLTSSSPARWAGCNVGLTIDYDGKPLHDPPSIGAYEYAPAQSAP